MFLTGSYVYACQAAGVGDSYAERQGSCPILDQSLVGRRIEVLFKMEIPDGGAELLWCSGRVDLFCDGTNMFPRSRYEAGKAAMIMWDANPNIGVSEEAPNGEPAHLAPQKLLPSKWNKDVEGAWRLEL